MSDENGSARRQAARVFAEKWAGIKSEKSYAQSFWGEFFTKVFGIDDLLTAGIDFERPVKNTITGQTDFIDVFWGGIVLIEHKSANIKLDVAEAEARAYLPSVAMSERPPFVVVSNFARFRIVNVLLNEVHEFEISDLPKELARFDAVFAGHEKRATVNEVQADRDAVRLMGNLYEAFENAGYSGHEVSVFLVRILFLLFGDDTEMWKKPNAFYDLVSASNSDGSDLGYRIHHLFRHLDTEHPHGTTPPALLMFPWVNGGLFSEVLPVFTFTVEMREALLKACGYEWSEISPAIFGAMLQTVKSKEERRELGEHYTSEANILKVIRPLFLDRLLERLERAWDRPNPTDAVRELRALRKDLGRFNFLDPACGSGNFLLVSYKRLREIELKILARIQEINKSQGQVGLALDELTDAGVAVKLTQFHGVEYEEWSTQIATVAMFLADRQANLSMDEIVGKSPDRFPLIESAKIVRGNALEVDWSDVCPMGDNTVILGNPPFIGSTDLNADQKNDVALLWGKTSGSGNLDYVASWFLVAAKHLEDTNAVAGFVATNSITQGQQPPVLWGELYKRGIGIDFAHRTFRWRNAGGKEASVYVVVVGFSDHSKKKPTRVPVWSYATPDSEPVQVDVSRLNAYLLEADPVLVKSRRSHVQDFVQPMRSGNKPVDEEHLSNITAEEAQQIRDTDPVASKYLRRVVGSQELINGLERWGLWLVDAPPSDLLASPELKKRVEAVKEFRLKSKKPSTREDAKRSWEWQEVTRQPKSSYLAIPTLSAEGRDYTPIAFLPPEVLANNLVSYVEDASLTTFGVLSSSVFTVWNKGVSGRFKGDPRISAEVTYNNFPFPDLSDVKRESAIEVAAQEVLDARASFPDATLAELYNRTVMPTRLRKAHAALDKAVLNAYGLKVTTSELGVLEKLFAMYKEIEDGLLASLTTPTRRKR